MPVSTKFNADTTDDFHYSMVFDDALKSLHVTGSVLLRENYEPPWGVAVPGSHDLSTLLETNKGVQIVAFHLVEFGHCVIETDGGEAHHLKAGEIAVCFGGQPHLLSQGKPKKTQNIESLLKGGPNLQKADPTSASDQTALLCGVFLLSHIELNPLISALPAVMRTSLSNTGSFNNLSGVARLMAEEIDRNAMGSNYVVERLLEILCAEVIRSYVESFSSHKPGWFKGIKDPIIGKALAAIHGHPGADWSVQKLASGVAMSPSRFAARFTESIGDSPMSYVTKWRINVACRSLANNKNSIDRVAETAGYDSPAAFSRAFKKHMGVSPTVWKAQN